MKQVININYQGRIIPIEVTAHDLLKSYVESLRVHFRDEPGKEEIINDIEDRVGELFHERLKGGAICITDADVEAVISSIGRPEQFDQREDEADAGTAAASEPTTPNGPRRLYRSELNKFMGGVCAGLADYFRMDVTIIRLLFIVMFFSFGIGLIPYIVLWAVVPSSTEGHIGAPRKKLYRDGENKLLGGVCAGLSEFLGIDVWIPRVFFLLPLIGSSIGLIGDWDHVENLVPGVFIAYLICWMVLPEAKTTAEKLEMKGRKVDLKSISQSITQEMKGVEQRLKKAGEEVKQQAGPRSRSFLGELGKALSAMIRGLVSAIGALLKGFVYLILGVLALSLFLTLFGLTVGSFALMPFSEYLLSGFWQQVFAWGTLFFFFVLLILESVVWLIRKIARLKPLPRSLRISLFSLNVLGLFSLAALAVSLTKDFSRVSHRNLEQEAVSIAQPVGDTLTINTRPNPIYNQSIGFFEALDLFADSLPLNNVKVKFLRSVDDSFHVRMVRSAHGRTRSAADTTASAIDYRIEQQAGALWLSESSYLFKKDKFRNQQVVLLIAIPEGKRVQLDPYSPLFEENEMGFDSEYSESRDSLTAVFQMTAEGLRRITDEKPRPHKTPVAPEPPADSDAELDSLLRLKKNLEQQIIQRQRAPRIAIHTGHPYIFLTHVDASHL